MASGRRITSCNTYLRANRGLDAKRVLSRDTPRVARVIFSNYPTIIEPAPKRVYYKKVEKKERKNSPISPDLNGRPYFTSVACNEFVKPRAQRARLNSRYKAALVKNIYLDGSVAYTVSEPISRTTRN